MTDSKRSAHRRPRRSSRIARNVKLANRVDAKVKRLKMPRSPSVGAHLSDLYISLEDFQELLDEFLSVDVKHHEAIGDALTRIRGEVEHIHYHARHLKRPLERITDFCYSDGDNGSLTEAEE